MRGRWWIAMFALGAGCEHDDAGPSLPACDESRRFDVNVLGHGDRITSSNGEEMPMVLVSSEAAQVTLEEQLDCDPQGEGSFVIESDAWAHGAWLPPLASEVRARYWDGWDGGYAVITAASGELLWEGGAPSSTVPSRFRLLEDVRAEPCAGSFWCTEVTYLGVAVQTDGGEVTLQTGDRREVTIDGEPYVAGVGWAARVAFRDCDVIIEDDGGPDAQVYLARSTPVDLPLAEPTEPAEDECPADKPVEWTDCSTRADLQCDYEDEQGCGFSLRCRGCFWNQIASSIPSGVDCGYDPFTCQGKGCPEESSCTECPCEGWTTERWRCVWPGDECPPCE